MQPLLVHLMCPIDMELDSLDIKIVPILVGAINYDKEVSYGKLLAPYLASKDTVFVISSDFCHWYGRSVDLPL